MSTYGLRRAHVVLPDGTERRLDPAPGTAERWRADLERDHPTASRRLAYVSWTVLVVALVLQVPQLLALGSVLTGWYELDRKSTRLNSSHVASTYAVFGLKKKKKQRRRDGRRQ